MSVHSLQPLSPQDVCAPSVGDIVVGHVIYIRTQCQKPSQCNFISFEGILAGDRDRPWQQHSNSSG